jgi:hypothetical protein
LPTHRNALCRFELRALGNRGVGRRWTVAHSRGRVLRTGDGHERGTRK